MSIAVFLSAALVMLGTDVQLPAGPPSRGAPPFVTEVRQEAKRVVQIKRNQNVTVIFSRNGLTISSYGKAMETGSVGERIRFYNINTKRVGVGRVQDAQTLIVGGP